MEENLETKLRAFARQRKFTDGEFADMWSKLDSERVRELSGLLASDLAELNSKLGSVNAKFLLGFIRSLPLDEAVLGAIGLTDPEDVEKITKTKYKEIADLLDSFSSEVAIEKAFSLEPPASSRLWKFVERFTPPLAPGEDVIC